MQNQNPIKINYRHPDSNFSQYLIKQHIPYWVYLELTYRCNLKCIHCYGVADKSKEELTTQEIYSLLGQLAEQKCFNLIFTGGEPFIRKDWFEIAAYARSKGLALSFFTNATLIDAVKARQLKELSPRTVYVTLFARQRQAYEEITRRKWSFAMAMAGINCLLQEKIPIKLRTTVLRQNFREIPLIEAFARKIKVPFFCNTTIIDNRIDGSKLPQEYLSAEKQMLQQGNKKPGNNNLPPRCPGGIFMASIGPYGDLYPCLFFRPPGYNLRQASFSYLWQNAKSISLFRSLKERDLDGEAIEWSFCKACLDCREKYQKRCHA